MSSTSNGATDGGSLQRQFGRQALRAPLVTEWFDAVRLHHGTSVADLGSGPGYVSLRAAERVGEHGRVYAVDESAEAIAMLQRTTALHHLTQIHAVRADVASLISLPGPVDAALLVMVLHHVDDPAGVLAHVHGLIPEDTRLLVAEFAPDGPGRVGPPLVNRLSPSAVREMAVAAGFDTDLEERQSAEHWFCVLTPA